MIFIVRVHKSGYYYKGKADHVFEVADPDKDEFISVLKALSEFNNLSLIIIDNSGIIHRTIRNFSFPESLPRIEKYFINKED